MPSILDFYAAEGQNKRCEERRERRKLLWKLAIPSVIVLTGVVCITFAGLPTWVQILIAFATGVLSSQIPVRYTKLKEYEKSHFNWGSHWDYHYSPPILKRTPRR